jgi:hypothetical protein
MDPVTDAEAEVARVAVALTAPADEECLYCYLRRMLTEFGCANDHRFTRRWAHGRKVRGRPVLRWAQDTGACCCDCEVILNSFGRPSTRRRGLLCAPALAELTAADQMDADPPAMVAGEPIDLLVRALDDVRMVRQPAEMASITTDFPGVAGAALYRALLRVEAEHLLAESDRLGPVLTGVLTAGDHRRDALIDLLGRIRAAPGGRALRFGSV